MAVFSKPMCAVETAIRAHGMPAVHVSQDGGHKQNQTQTTSSPNYLSLASRKTAKGDKIFDHDGPGHLSVAGKRHDNDHVNVRDIKIFPTVDEILSQRAPYMPYKRITQPHFLERGPERLVDTLFRQLRHDSIEVLKDCTYAAAQKLATATKIPSDYEPSQETANGNRHYFYWGAEFEELHFDDRQGLMATISYACPKNMRGRKMGKSGRFERGMVVALVGLDEDGVSLSVTFFEVHVCHSTEPMDLRGGNGKKASVRLLFAEKDNEEDVRRIVNYSQGLSKGRFALVEFPKYLLHGFYPVLKKIQNLSWYDLGMTNLYAPRSKGEENVGVLPPSYALRDSAFLNLDGFRKAGHQASNEPLQELVKSKEKFLNLVMDESTLNEAQAKAFVKTMSSEFAFVQGPPGTGKTFLGAALTKSILSARGEGMKPILVVCTTNHALDSFLGDLVDQGITKIARLGGGSKEEWTKKYALTTLSQATKATGKESYMRSKAFSGVNEYASSGADICEAVNAPNKLGWYIASPHLEKNYKSIHNQLVVASRPTDGLHSSAVSDKAAAFPFAFWCAGGDLEVFDTKLQADFAEFLGQNNLKGGDLAANAEIVANVLKDVIAQTKANIEKSDNNIWILPLSERQQMLEKWASEIDQSKTAAEIVDIHLQHQNSISELKDARRSIDTRCLAGKQVIGATTTAVATHWDLLKDMGIEVVLCEEAGQVMEAHTICTLFQSVEHAIFIGDPLQLRPQVNEQALSIETKIGSQYRLDESMFERLMDSKSGIPALPYSQLNIQRRMHPEISLLLKKTLYPNLKDHPSTEEHSSVGGINNRTYWVDHRIPEDVAVTSGSSKSFSNKHEVEMVAGLVRYLVNSNAYGLNDIVVLTPYNGQLAELTLKLSSNCKLWLSEKDRESLLDEGFLDEESLEQKGQVELQMKDMLRISTIDNFQGEEAKVVILSTVRSNAERRPGFLRTNNRINVACSRARDGFYVVGNSASLEVVPMWKDIIDVFRQNKCLGPSLRIMPCSRNPDHCVKPYDVSRPADFEDILKCESVCGEVLSCGHTCKEICHPPEFHGTRDMKCQEKCNKTHPNCKHECEKTCGEPCGVCKYEFGTTTLECGHVVAATCADDSWGSEPACDAVVAELDLDCGHKFSVKCDLRDEKPICTQDCIFELPCGHKCGKKCIECPKSGHASCLKKCEKVLDCSHKCNVGCHPGEPCPPCEQPCKRKCSHKKCSTKCSGRCEPCTKVVIRGCDHKETNPMLCGFPSGITTCNEVLEYAMPCGHIFPGLCGEDTPTSCVECQTGSKPTSTMVNISCGHNFEVGKLDRHIKFPSVDNKSSIKSLLLRKITDYNLTCPTCGKGIEDVKRYNVLREVENLSSNVDRFISEIGHKLHGFGKSISFNESQLNKTFSDFCNEIRPTPLAASANRRKVQERAKELLEVQEQIAAVKKQLVLPVEDSLQQLQQLFDNDSVMKKYVFQFATRFDLLFYRCRHAFLQEILKVSSYLVTLKDPSYQTRILAESLRRAVIKFGTENIDELGITIGSCEEKKLPCVEVELRLLQLSVHCLVKRARQMDCLRGKAMTENATIFGVEGEVNDQAERGNSHAGFEAGASLTRISDLSQRYPHSAGKYAQQASGIKSSLNNGLKPGPIFTEAARVVERGWGECGVGRVTRCGNGHPYPAGGVFEDCPECGHEKTPSKKPDYEVYLAEDKFLTWLRNKK